MPPAPVKEPPLLESVQSAEKSPVRSAVVNTVFCPDELGISKRWSWKSAKKKSLFLRIGPPTVPPNIFHRSFCLGSAGYARLFDQLFAFRTSFRKNSQTSPWRPLVPDLIVALIMPPSKLPNSAGALLVMRLNSWIASGAG